MFQISVDLIHNPKWMDEVIRKFPLCSVHGCCVFVCFLIFNSFTLFFFYCFFILFNIFYMIILCKWIVCWLQILSVEVSVAFTKVQTEYKPSIPWLKPQLKTGNIEFCINKGFCIKIQKWLIYSLPRVEKTFSFNARKKARYYSRLLSPKVQWWCYVNAHIKGQYNTKKKCYTFNNC